MSDAQTDLEKILDSVANVKDLVAPDTKDISDIEFSDPVQFKKDAGKPISVNTQLDDYELARKTIHGILEDGNVALKEILRVAINSDHPRAFEVVSTLMKTLGETSKDLLKLQEQMIDMRKKLMEDKDSPSGGVMSDGAFEGTLEQLLIEEENLEKDEPEDEEIDAT